ncbi:DNA repair protein RecO [Carboxylicivirga sediminis]|uniref:DNA repair protein RecO n=1 Tax=Carboxylicivirga sediminis TaxID=2006564 RepID=A0A941IWC4_9BACT|nr:DNA repair protein RecO [Carboxylicivirga sediminis]MBR8535080.1 DNA repair protein RecO [Carboxylicivirga sediminis]
MIHTTKGIVLNHVKYRETSIIVSVYTEKFGRQSYMVNKVRTRRNKGNTVLLQPMTLLDMQVYHRPKADIQRIKDFKVAHPLSSIPFEQEKRAMAFFLTELMSKVLREEEENTDLFSFIYHGIALFDSGLDGAANFHLFFLFQLTRFLGFGPEKATENQDFFDLMNGHFTNAEPSHGFFITQQVNTNWKKLFDLQVDNLRHLHLKSTERYKLLEAILEYYQLHIDTLGELKSLPIVHQLFHDE